MRPSDIIGGMHLALRRIGIILLTLLIVSFLVFLLQELSAGDSSAFILSEEASAAEREAYREANGLNGSFTVRYIRFLSSFLSGHWGRSVSGLDIREMILRRLPVTLSLTVMSIILALAVSVPLSVLAVRFRLCGCAVTALSVVIMSMPSFLVAVFIIILLSVHLGLFPPAGYIAPDVSPAGFIHTVFLPSLTLALLHASLYMRIFRKALEENLASSFSESFLAMGIKRSQLVMKSAFRPSLPVLVSLIAGSFASSAAGSAVTETVFAIPGIGSLLVDAALTRDAALSGVLVILISFAVSVANAVFELLLFVADPRSRRKP